MNTVNYDRGKLLQAGIGCPILGVAGLAIVSRLDGIAAVIVIIGALCLLAIGPVALAKALGDRTALRYDQSSLFVATLWSRRTLQWPEVLDIGTERLSFYTFFGLIKTSSTEYLTIKTHGGVLGSKKVRLLAGLLETGPMGVPGIVADLDAARNGAAPLAAGSTPGTIPRGRDPLEGAPRSEAFDPDAAIARYMATRSAQPVEIPPQPVRPAFGRKGLSG